MKILQQIVLSAALATSMLAFSTSTMANEKKEVISVKVLIDTTISHIEAAIAATNAGEKNDVILDHIKAARQTQKDIIVGKLDQQRQKASAKLLAAGHHIKEGKTKESKASLEEALVAFKDLGVVAEK